MASKKTVAAAPAKKTIAAKSAVKKAVAAKPAAKPVAKAAAKPAAKAAAPKAAVKPAAKPVAKAAAPKAAVKPAAKPIAKAVAPKAAVKAAVKPVAKTAAPKAAAKPVAKAVVPKAAAKPAVKAAAVSDVVFSVYAPESTGVSVAGEFNGWSVAKGAMKKAKDGVWSLKTQLAPGSYQYKLVFLGADGQEYWEMDNSNPERMADGQGGENSIKHV